MKHIEFIYIFLSNDFCNIYFHPEYIYINKFIKGAILMIKNITKEKVLGTRGIKNRIKSITQYKAIIFVLVIISLLSVANSILIYQYAISINSIYDYNNSQDTLLLGEIKAEIDKAIETSSPLENVSLMDIQAKLEELMLENEELLAQNIDLQNSNI